MGITGASCTDDDPWPFTLGRPAAVRTRAGGGTPYGRDGGRRGAAEGARRTRAG
ncbi:hypothetical protein AB0C10_07070 [Microbispora amethystogenes]|uniref:hypothetical protein n=1 Tax=Microbispora amethystogenes TaxID=1427754 RepID=UPI0033FABB56